MGYRLAKGQSHLFHTGTRDVDSQPDGDSAWFKPDDFDHLNGLDGRSAKKTAGGFVQLRFEGIDTLKLHFRGKTQQRDLAQAARDYTLRQLGFRSVSYSGGEGLAVQDASPHPVRGHILTRNVDPHGRPVSFVFAGEASGSDGAAIFLDVARLNQSVNARLMHSGNAYPGYYTGLPSDLRERLTDLELQAWEAGRGIWRSEAGDCNMDGFRVRNAAELEQIAIWHKLLRRLVAYFGKVTSRSLDGFDAWLRADSGARDDQLWIIPEAELANLHDVVEISGGTMSMRYWPEELVVVPR